MIRRVLLGVFLGLALACPLRADALDDELAAARKLLMEDKVEEAAARLDALEARARTATGANPGNAHAQYVLGMAAMYAGRDKPAKTALDTAARLEPKNARYALGRAEFAMYTDAPKDAAAALREIVALEPKNLELLEMYGQTLQAAGDSAAALAAFEQILEINPKHVLALANIGHIHQLRGNWDKAIDAYTRVVAINSADYLAIAKLVQLNEAAGKIKERDAARAQIYALHAGGKVPVENYCREQFNVGDRRAMAFESFAPRGPEAVRYAFNIVSADGKTVEMRLALSSAAQTTAGTRATGPIRQNDRTFQFDVFTDIGHKSLGMFTRELTYEETRDMVKQYLAGTLTPASSPITGTQPATATQGGAR